MGVNFKTISSIGFVWIYVRVIVARVWRLSSRCIVGFGVRWGVRDQQLCQG